MFRFALIFWLVLQQPVPTGVPGPKRVEAPRELIQAAEKGDVGKIRDFSQHPGFGNADTKGRTALLVAGEKGQKAAFAEIITIVNERTRKEALRVPHEGQDAVEDLMKAVQARMSFFNAADKKGQTPLMHAARRGWDDLVRFLLDGGATPDNRDTDGRSAADYADKAGYRALASTLREQTK